MHVTHNLGSILDQQHMAIGFGTNTSGSFWGEMQHKHTHSPCDYRAWNSCQVDFDFFFCIFACQVNGSESLTLALPQAQIMRKTADKVLLGSLSLVQVY